MNHTGQSCLKSSRKKLTRTVTLRFRGIPRTLENSASLRRSVCRKYSTTTSEPDTSRKQRPLWLYSPFHCTYTCSIPRHAMRANQEITKAVGRTGKTTKWLDSHHRSWGNPEVQVHIATGSIVRDIQKHGYRALAQSACRSVPRKFPQITRFKVKDINKPTSIFLIFIRHQS